jgi:steroid 5-alpha reductase family enzyme
MKKDERNALVVIIVIILIGVGVALAGSQKGSQIAGLPVFAVLVGLAFVIQWVVFIPSYIAQTEKYFDLTGAITNITLTILALILSSNLDARAFLVAAMVIVWAGRLGTFLFLRVKKAGKDGRFDDLKPSFIRFFNVWTIQGLWITLTVAVALIAITTTTRKDLGVFAIVGFLIWLFGFTIEVVADAQKSRWNAKPENKGKFINTGLWSRSRHPNYFGEISLWLGVTLVAVPVLQGWQWIALISPIFVTILLTRVSGIPMLEKRADEKWGGQEDYERYKKETPVLIPRI